MMLRLSCRIHRNVGYLPFSSKASGINLCGIFPPIPTPFNADETIAYDKLTSNMKAWEKIPFAGYVVQGSNGEYPLLSPRERVEMVERVRKLTSKDKLLIAGSSGEGTRITVEMTNEMAAAGADAVLVTTPSYFKSSMTETALFEHYTRLANLSSVPVILYNMPANTGLDLSAPLVTRLAAHPNIIGIKDSGGDVAKMSRIVEDTRHLGFQVVAGSTGFLLPALLMGCVGGINGLANILGEEVCLLYQLYTQGRMEEAVGLHMKLVTANALVTREMGVPAMKKALDLVGLYGGPCRQPLQPLTPAQTETLAKVFASLKQE